MEILTPQIGHKRIDAIDMKPGTTFWDHKKDIWLVTDSKTEEGVACINLVTNKIQCYRRHCGGREVRIEFDTLAKGGTVTPDALNIGDTYLFESKPYMVLGEGSTPHFTNVVELRTGTVTKVYCMTRVYPCICKGIVVVSRGE